MAAASAREAGPPAARDRWYEKSPGAPLVRFPVLGEAMTAVARAWTDSFCALSASQGELTFKTLRATTAAELMDQENGLPILASLRVPAWDAVVGLALSRPLVSTVVEALFGGAGEEDGRADSRPVSPVEMRIVDVFGGQAAVALTAGFRDFAPTRFEFDRTHPKPDPRFLGKPGLPLLAAAFEIRAVGRTVPFDVVLPLGAVEDGAAVWGGASAAAPMLDGTRWTSQLRAEVTRAALSLQASIAMGPLSLGAIAGWRVGDVLELPPASGSNVLLSCEKEALFRCDLGQSAGRYTVRVEERTAADRQPSRKDG